MKSLRRYLLRVTFNKLTKHHKSTLDFDKLHFSCSGNHQECKVQIVENLGERGNDKYFMKVRHNSFHLNDNSLA